MEKMKKATRRLIASAAISFAISGALSGAAWAQETEGTVSLDDMLVAAPAQEAAPSVSLDEMLAAVPAEDESVVRRRLAERFVALTEGEGIAELMDAMSEVMMSLLPDMPEDERAWFRQNLPLEMTAFAGRLTEQMVPLFADAMTVEELETLIAFYETPMGRSIAQKQMEIGAQMGIMMEFAQIEFQYQFMQKYCAAFDCTGRAPDVARST